MAENKTRPEATSVEAFIASAEPSRQADARELVQLMSRISGDKPVMWGASIIGFGSYHYRYASGREGDMCRVGFSPRKANLVIYLVDGYEERSELLARLGPHKIGKSCLYLKSLASVDRAVLETLVRESLATMAERYPT